MNTLPRIPVWLIILPLAAVAIWSLLLPAARSFAEARAADATAHQAAAGPQGASSQSCDPANASFGQGHAGHHPHAFGFGFGAWSQPRHNDMETCPPAHRPDGRGFSGRGWFRVGGGLFPMHHPGPGGPDQGAFH